MDLSLLAQSSAMYEDQSPFVPKDSGNTGFVNGFTGLLSKAADTYLDIAAGKAKIGSLYPTGQVSPGVVNAQTVAGNQQIAMTNLRPWIIGGGIALAAVVLLVVISKK